MPKITTYKTVAGRDALGFELSVNEAIKSGWQPIGGPMMLVSQSGALMVQALVKYEDALDT